MNDALRLQVTDDDNNGDLPISTYSIHCTNTHAEAGIEG